MLLIPASVYLHNEFLVFREGCAAAENPGVYFRTTGKKPKSDLTRPKLNDFHAKFEIRTFPFRPGFMVEI